MDGHQTTAYHQEFVVAVEQPFCWETRRKVEESTARRSAPELRKREDQPRVFFFSPFTHRPAAAAAVLPLTTIVTYISLFRSAGKFRGVKNTRKIPLAARLNKEREI